jgi:hypothetical protein
VKPGDLIGWVYSDWPSMDWATHSRPLERKPLKYAQIGDKLFSSTIGDYVPVDEIVTVLSCYVDPRTLKNVYTWMSHGHVWSADVLDWTGSSYALASSITILPHVILGTE